MKRLSSKEYMVYLKILGYVVAVVVVLYLYGVCFSLLWNGVMPLFKLPKLGTNESLYLLALVWFLRFVGSVSDSTIKARKINANE